MKYATTILLAALLAMMIPAGALRAADGEREGERKVERKREGEGERKREGEGERKVERKREGEGERKVERKREGEGERKVERKREGEGDRRREVDGQRNQEGRGDRRREGEVEGRGEMGQIRQMLANISARLTRMERELAELRRVNANLKRELGRPAGADGEGERRGEVDGRRREGEGARKREGEGARKREGEGDRKREGEGDRKREGEGERAAAGLPDGMAGFKGMLEGVIVKKGERGFVLKVTKITKIWSQSSAKNPRKVIGQEIEILIQAELAVTDRWKRLTKEHLQILASLKPGERVAVEAFHFKGDHLTVVEGLRKIT